MADLLVNIDVDDLDRAIAFYSQAFGLTVGRGNVWLRYVLGVRSAARQGALPRRPARFLDWCLNTGLMRMAGNSIQFRHRQLQDSLVTSPGRSPAPAAASPFEITAKWHDVEG